MNVPLGLSWQEDFDAAGKARFAGRAVAALDAQLPADAGQRLYLVTGHPRIAPGLQAALARLAQAEPDLREVARPSRPPAWAASRSALFAHALALVLDLGPPEVCALALSPGAAGDPDRLGETVTRLVEQPGSAGPGVARLAFDEGDLVRID